MNMASPEQVYVELLDEGSPVIRPTLAMPVADGYRLLPTAGYDPEDEHWEFTPGSIVRVRQEIWDGKKVMVAREAVSKEVR